jgi:ubiquinone/menaquinone biosynthesis C-methylase UbiE
MFSDEPEKWQETYHSRTDVYEKLSDCAEEGVVIARLLHSARFRQQVVLEIGCGTGKQTRPLAPLCSRYVALDESAPMLEIAEKRCHQTPGLTFVQTDAQNLPFADRSFDVIFSGWCLDGIWPPEAREKAFSEADRVLAPAGHVWLATNHGTGEFMEMEGEAAVEYQISSSRFVLEHGFEYVETVESAFNFASLDEAKQVLGFILGQKASDYLGRHPNPRVQHLVALYHKKKAGVIP